MMLWVLFLMVFPLELVLTLNNFSVFFMARLSSFDSLLISKTVGELLLFGLARYVLSFSPGYIYSVY
jgi:hypothetical protein